MAISMSEIATMPVLDENPFGEYDVVVFDGLNIISTLDNTAISYHDILRVGTATAGGGCAAGFHQKIFSNQIAKNIKCNTLIRHYGKGEKTGLELTGTVEGSVQV